MAVTRSPQSGHRTLCRHNTPCRFQPKCILESPKSPITQNTYNSVIPIPFSDFINAYYGPLSQLSNAIRFTLAPATIKNLSNCLYPGVTPNNAPGFRHSEFRHNNFASMILLKNLHTIYRMRGDISSVNGANNNQIICQI